MDERQLAILLELHRDRRLDPEQRKQLVDYLHDQPGAAAWWRQANALDQKLADALQSGYDSARLSSEARARINRQLRHRRIGGRILRKGAALALLFIAFLVTAPVLWAIFSSEPATLRPIPIAPSPSNEPIAAPAPVERETITVAFDNVPSYFPAVIMDAQDLLEQRGYILQLVPFGVDGRNNYSLEERYLKLRSGEWDVLATPLENFALYADPQIGAITTIVDQSAGVHKIVARPEITTLKALRGKRVAFTEQSVDEYFLYYALSRADITPADVILVPKETATDAMQAYLNGEVDALSAWNPDVRLVEEQGARTLMTSNELRAILDVLVTSRTAIETKPAAVQAFHDAWYEALRLMIDEPAVAGQVIVDWGNADWTFIGQASDLAEQLVQRAQATLEANQMTFQSPNILQSRIQEAHGLWVRLGKKQISINDVRALIDGRFVMQSATQPQLFATQSPVNNSFLLPGNTNNSSAIVELPLSQVDFEPEAIQLTTAAIEALQSQVTPVLQASSFSLKIEAVMEWPGPAGRFTEQEVKQRALSRARAVAAIFTEQGIDSSRLRIGVLEPKYPQSTDVSQLAQDRIVRFRLVDPDQEAGPVVVEPGLPTALPSPTTVGQSLPTVWSTPRTVEQSPPMVLPTPTSAFLNGYPHSVLVPFNSNTLQLTTETIESLNSQVLPVLQSSNAQIWIEGGSVWPGPEGTFSKEPIEQAARDRATHVAAFLVQQGIDPNRLFIGPPLASQCPNCLDETQMALDQVVRITFDYDGVISGPGPTSIVTITATAEAP